MPGLSMGVARSCASAPDLGELDNSYISPVSSSRQLAHESITHIYDFTVMSPTVLFAGYPYFAVFRLAISLRISWFTALPIPYVKMMIEFLSSVLQSRMVLKISDMFASDGSPSVRNNITFFLVFPSFSETVALNNSHAFSKAILYLDVP